MEVPSPYKNKSIELVIDWQNSGSCAKSNKEINCLVRNILRHPDFHLEELEHFNVARKNCKVDVADLEENPLFLLSFTHTNISINMPSGSKLTPPRSFSIPGLYYHKITSLIQESFQSPIFRHFHLSLSTCIKSTQMARPMNAYILSCMTQTSSTMNMTKYSVHRATMRHARERKSWQP
jgi:hypothetical protein